MLDNVDTSSSSRDDSQAPNAADERADARKDGVRANQDINPSGRPQPLDEDDEPPGKASAVQAGAAWDKARSNGQGISSLHNPARACTIQNVQHTSCCSSYHAKQKIFGTDDKYANIAEDNGWGPGIPNLQREDWDWGAAAGRSSSRSSSNGSSPGGWSKKQNRPAAESTWNEPGII